MTANTATSVEHLRRQSGGTTERLSLLASEELDRRVKDGWDQWCELADDLLATNGTLPSPELVGRLLRFFEDSYWRAEQAHDEVLNRELGPGRSSHRQSPNGHGHVLGL